MTYTIIGVDTPIIRKPQSVQFLNQRRNQFPNKSRKFHVIFSKLNESTTTTTTPRQKKQDADLTNGFKVETQDTQTIQNNIEFLKKMGYSISQPDSKSENGVQNLQPGSPLVESALQKASKNPTVTEIQKIFPYELDDFQKRGLQVLIDGQDLVVCAPTGSGKTSVATGATFATLVKGQRTIYTTPLKALSNQKYNEFKELFGEKRVGLQTGDVVYNANAEIVVMTTEILRNQLYREDSEAYMGVVQNVGSIGLVVLDEVHYLSDRYRGTVWEEIIINCPKHIQMVAMSATVLNPDDLGRWISNTHRECQTIQTSHRPVPLKFWYGFKSSTYKEKNYKKQKYNLNDKDDKPFEIIDNYTKIVTLKGKNDKGMNPILANHDSTVFKAVDEEIEEEKQEIKQKKIDADLDSDDLEDNNNLDDDLFQDDEEDYYEEQKSKQKFLAQITKMQGPPTSDLIHEMKRRDMLPAIYFIFSRLRCDNEALKLYEKGVKIVNEEEFAIIFKETQRLRQENPDSIRESMVEPLCAGIASHHAGCLPAWKALIESLFQRGLVKIVFATETLAAGINMPARTTIISTLGRRRDMELQRLTNNELLQMSGRAGRRGFDEQGHTILLYSELSKPKTASRLLSRNSEPLESQFTATFSMVLNLLTYRNMKQAKNFVNKSFRSFMKYKGDGNLRRQLRDIGDDIRDIYEEIEAKESKAYQQLANEEKMYVANTVIEARQKRIELIRNLVENRSKIIQEKIKDQKFPIHVAVEIRKKQSGAMPVGAICLGIFDSQFIKTYKKQKDSHNTIFDLIKRGRSARERKWDYLVCLGSDNKVYVVHPGVICAVGGGFKMNDEVRLELIEQVKNEAEGTWSELKHEMPGYHVPGTAQMIQFSYIIDPASKMDKIEMGGREKEIVDVGRQLKVLKKERREIRKKTKKAPKDYKNTRGRLGDVNFYEYNNDYKQDQAPSKNERVSSEIAELYEKVARLTQAASRLKKNLRRILRAPSDQHWLEFEAVTRVLLECKALNQKMKPTDLGLIARDLRGDHELFLALALTHDQLSNLSASQQVGVLGALLAGPTFHFKDNVQCMYKPSEKVSEVVDSLSLTSKEVQKVQKIYDLDRPIYIDKRLCGLVEAWAQGESWAAINEGCSVDEGDVGRLLMRIIDFLKQVIYIEEVWEDVRNNCKLALLEMDRAPVSEVYQ